MSERALKRNYTKSYEGEYDRKELWSEKGMGCLIEREMGNSLCFQHGKNLMRLWKALLD